MVPHVMIFLILWAVQVKHILELNVYQSLNVILCYYRTTLLKRFPRLNLPLQAIVCTAAFAFALPLAISLFPQMSEVSYTLSHLENGSDVKRCMRTLLWHHL